MGINANTNKFAADLHQLIGQAGLPPANVRLVLQLELAQVTAVEQQVMAQEQAAERAAMEQKKGASENERHHNPPDQG